MIACRNHSRHVSRPSPVLQDTGNTVAMGFTSIAFFSNSYGSTPKAVARSRSPGIPCLSL
jgi:hypothetical protein